MLTDNLVKNIPSGFTLASACLQAATVGFCLVLIYYLN